MKKHSSNKGLLLPWLLKALNDQLYNGLKWSDKQKKIFYILWTHKSAEQWTKDDLEPFEAWAEHKGKLIGKNEKQLKATFRCALNSKKELKEVYRTRSRRYWQFVDPESTEKKENCMTEKRKGGYGGSGAVCKGIKIASVTDMKYINSLSPHERSMKTIYAESSSSSKLPNFEAFCSFASLTPPHQANEISFDLSETKLFDQKPEKKQSYTFKTLAGDIFEGITPNTISGLTKDSSSVGSNSEVCRTGFTPSPNHSQPLPSLKTLPTTSQYNPPHQPTTDVWQPNCWSTSLPHQDFNSFSQSKHFDVFPSDFDELYKSSTKNETLSFSSKMDFVEMDQSVPVMDISQNVRIVNKYASYHCTSKTVLECNQPDPMRLEDDYLLGDVVDQEACERIMQELNRLTPPAENGHYSYHS